MGLAVEKQSHTQQKQKYSKCDLRKKGIIYGKHGHKHQRHDKVGAATVPSVEVDKI